MEGWNIGEVVAVSRYWTPQHKDMTYAPVEYARNKPSWIDRLDEHRSLAQIDSRDRMKRRALHSNTQVNPEEVRQLPPIVEQAPEVIERPEVRSTIRIWTSWLRERDHEPDVPLAAEGG